MDTPSNFVFVNFSVTERHTHHFEVPVNGNCLDNHIPADLIAHHLMDADQDHQLIVVPSALSPEVADLLDTQFILVLQHSTSTEATALGHHICNAAPAA